MAYTRRILDGHDLDDSLKAVVVRDLQDIAAQLSVICKKELKFAGWEVGLFEEAKAEAKSGEV